MVQMNYIDRIIKKYLIKDLQEKTVLLSGPGQSGKTTLSKMISGDKELKREKSMDTGSHVRSVVKWLTNLNLSNLYRKSPGNSKPAGGKNERQKAINS